MGILEEITIKRRVPCAQGAPVGRERTSFPSCADAPRRWHLRRHDGYFVDLFVRKSNSVAIGMYEKARRLRCAASRRSAAHAAALQFGYSVYRQVIGYYSGEEDAYGAYAKG